MGVFSALDTDALMLKLQAINIHSAEYVLIVWDQFLAKYCIYSEQH